MSYDAIRDAMIEQLPTHGGISFDGFLAQAGIGEAALEASGGRADLEREWNELQAQANVISKLSRQGVPRDLEGRVVAAAEAGFRQDRIVAKIAGLPRLEVPPTLDASIRRLAEQPFPQRSARAVPSELDHLVEAEFEAAKSKNAGELSPGTHRPRRLRRMAGLALAAGLFLAARVAWMGPVDQDPTLSFRVVQVESIDDVDPALAGLLDSMSGGMLMGRRAR